MFADKCISDAMKAITAAETFVVDYLAKATRTQRKYVYFLTILVRTQEIFESLAVEKPDVAIALTWLVSLSEIRQCLQAARR